MSEVLKDLLVGLVAGLWIGWNSAMVWVHTRCNKPNNSGRSLDKAADDE